MTREEESNEDFDQNKEHQKKVSSIRCTRKDRRHSELKEKFVRNESFSSIDELTSDAFDRPIRSTGENSRCCENIFRKLTKFDIERTKID